ncbi:MAG: DEAD/DEAH box helicase [Candidatus Uhrbacteria bacterium]
MRQRDADTRTLDLFAWRTTRTAITVTVPPFRLIDPTAVENRPYLEHARREWAAGGSIGIVADTSSGKTYIALTIADNVLADGGRILFCAPTNPLCALHAELAQRLFRFSDSEVVVARGSARQRSAVWKSGRILIATPHATANDIRRGLIDLSTFGLVVIDECHHAARRYPAIDVAAAAHKHGIRVLGLTASPGGNVERIERIKTNLGLDRWVAIPEEATQPFRPPVTKSRIAIPIGLDLAPIVTDLETVIKRCINELADAGYLQPVPTAASGIKDGLPSPQTIEAARKSAAQDFAFSLIPSAVAALQLTAALSLLVSCDYASALSSLERAIGRTHCNSRTKTARRLAATAEVGAARAALRSLAERNVAHPKEVALIATLRAHGLTATSGPQSLVYVRSTACAGQLAARIRAEIGGVVTVAFGRSAMHPRDTLAAIDAFRRGETRVLVASPVIREGLHLPAVDLLVEYSPVLNENERIQLHGRVGRTQPGTIVSLVAEHDLDRRYAFSAEMKEQRMRRILVNSAARNVAVGLTDHCSAFSKQPQKSPETFVATLAPGFVFERFAIRQGTVAEGRNSGRPFARFTIGDRTGILELLHWCPNGRAQAASLVALFAAGTIVIVRGVLDGAPDRRIIVSPREGQSIVACPTNDYDPTDYEQSVPF